MMGHKCIGSNMLYVYDNPGDDELLEEQRAAFPTGPCGFILPRVTMDEALPVELVEALHGCLKGTTRPTEFMELLTAYLLRQLDKKPVQSLVTWYFVESEGVQKSFCAAVSQSKPLDLVVLDAVWGLLEEPCFGDATVFRGGALVVVSHGGVHEVKSFNRNI